MLRRVCVHACVGEREGERIDNQSQKRYSHTTHASKFANPTGREEGQTPWTQTLLHRSNRKWASKVLKAKPADRDSAQCPPDAPLWQIFKFARTDRLTIERGLIPR